MRALSAKTDGVGVGGSSRRTDFDIVAAGEVEAAIETDTDVTATRGVVVEGRVSDGGIVKAGGVQKKCLNPTGLIAIAGGVALEGGNSIGGIIDTCAVGQ